MSGSADDAARARSARRWGWAILLSTGCISLTFNVAHAVIAVQRVHVSRGVHDAQIALAVLYGVTPVGVALALSHLIAIQAGGWGKRIATGLVFVAAMALSVTSIADVIQPIAGHWRYVFPLMLDVASLLALNEILASGTRQQDGVPHIVPEAAQGAVPDRPGSVPERLERPVPANTLPAVPEGDRTADEPVAEPPEDGRPGTGMGQQPAAGRKGGTAKTEKRPADRPGTVPPPRKPAVPELVSRLRDDYPGETPDTVPGIGQIKSRYGVGTDKATAAQHALKAERATRPEPSRDAVPPNRPHLVPVRDRDTADDRPAAGGTN